MFLRWNHRLSLAGCERQILLMLTLPILAAVLSLHHSVAFAQSPILFDPDGCAVVLQPAEYVARQDRSLGFNYVSLLESTKFQANVFADFVEAASVATSKWQGSTSFEKFRQDIRSNLNFSEHHHLAVKWIRDEQLKTFEQCKKGVDKGMIAYVKSVSNSSVTVSVTYRPRANQPMTYPLRNSLEFVGAADKVKANIPETIKVNETHDLIVDRKKGSPLKINLAYPDGPIEINIPILAEFPCMEVDPDNGQCQTLVHYLRDVKRDDVIQLPVGAAGKARALLRARVEWSTNMVGSAGLIDLQLATAKKTESISLTPAAGVPAIDVDGVLDDVAVVNGRTEPIRLSVRCRANAPGQPQATCGVRGVVVVKPVW